MRVLHVIPSVAPRDGGPAHAVRAMAAGQALLGAEVTVAATNADGRGVLDVPVDHPVVESGVEYRFFPRTGKLNWKPSLSLGRWLSHHAADYDVVHVHACFSYATIPGCRSARAAGVPYVLRPLGTLDQWSLEHRSWKKAPYYTLVEKSHLEHAAAIHATSDAEAQAVTALGFGDKVRVIPLGVVAAPIARTPSADGAVRVLFLSRVHHKKGLPLLIEAIARLRARGGVPVRLTIAGEGDASYVAELQHLVQSLGVDKEVRFVGHVEGDAKRAVLADADIFALPSYQENFGIAVAEAMASGLPVVVSDQVAIEKDVRETDAGIVVPTDDHRIATAIAELVDDPARRRAMGERAARAARERWSWETTSHKLLDLYAEIGAREAVHA